MKCMAYGDCKEWLDMAGIEVSKNRSLLYENPQDKPVSIIIADLPKVALQLGSFSSSLVRWLPNNFTRMLWLDDWNTYPAYKMATFKKIRQAYHEARDIIDAPGHLFEPFDGDDDAFYEHEESGVLCGLVFMVLSFDWRGYIISKDCADHIILADETVVFYSDNDIRFNQAISLAERFGLSYKRHELAPKG